MAYDFHSLGIDVHGRTSGTIKTTCPKCHEQRSDKRDKSLSVNLTEGIYNCHYCGWKGKADNGTVAHKRQEDEPLVSGGAWQRTASPSPKAPTAPMPVPAPTSDHLPLDEAQTAWLTRTRNLSPEAIAGLGIDAARHFMPQTGKKELCVCFNYFENGKRVNTKFRTTPEKNFALVAGAELIPYNIDAIRDTPECILTEGEIDAASFFTIGREDVISLPAGANSNLGWMDRFAESHFENKRIVYIAVDTDTKGVAAREELMRRIGAERCRIVTYGPDCKDANELLCLRGREALLQALHDAPEQPLEGVYTARDVDRELHELFENGLTKGADTGLENFDAFCTFETKRLCVVTGHPGEGKSEFVDELVLRLCLRHHWRAAYFSPENSPLVYHLGKLMEKLTGHKFKKGFTPEDLYEAGKRYLAENISSILPREDYSADTILSRARELVSRRGIRILVIDPFNKLEHQIPAGQTETQYISAFLDKLSNFALRNDCLAILVAHPRKMQRDPMGRLPVPTLQDINGSAAFVNKADFGLVVERDRQAGVTRVHIKKVKFRNLGNIGEASFVYNVVNGRFSPCREDPEAEDPGRRVTDTKFDAKPWIGRLEQDGKQEELRFLDRG